MNKGPFDKIIDRNGTNSVKFDFKKENHVPEDVLPMWVADMDFETAPAVIERMKKEASFGIYGYSDTKQSYIDAVKNWYKTRFDWEIDGKWIVKTPGVVFAMASAIRAFTKEGDAILIQRPVYYPFGKVIEDNNRKIINSPLILENGYYHMDLKDFENKIISERVKMFFLCNPHNPVGRVWKKEELEQVADICLRHEVIVFSDEIHSDFVYSGNHHTVFTTVDKHLLNCTITATAPSKTFNLAGLQLSNIFIPNEKLRHAFLTELKKQAVMEMNLFGTAACEAAYIDGADWLDQLKVYLEENIAFVRSFLEKEIPKIQLIEPQGTYLLWLDVRKLGYTETEMEDRLLNKGKLWIENGSVFGAEGEGFLRMNIASPRSVVEDGMKRLKQACR